MTTSILTAAAVSAVALALSAPAFAADPDIVTTSVTVKTADLNLDSDPGVRTLLARIHGAAGNVCGPAPDLREMVQMRAYDACRRTTVDRAVADSGNARLAALNAGDHRRLAILAANR